ncbi:hypothetical protein PAXINDRAFT_11459 [Paxillus involutus ATCC 200175]|uniref:F-box domain-containing protein n=1 Tax=Paxillus involutus ATCC 200175 TaxID=664439 RepID=A0A0C9U952_PAXIN|nr:hypothetical protein PAXINDRAFT_11459 [Paxillus involutus ATCC 200175]
MSVDALIQELALPNPCVTESFDTPYSKYSNMNYSAPGQTQIHAIGEIISQRQAQLSDVTRQLASAQAAVTRIQDLQRRLLEKRKHIVASMEAHQAFISCIRRLPPEILGEIFIQCLPPHPHIKPSSRAAPLLLTRICRGWRQVAFSTPRLWCSLELWWPRLPRIQQESQFYHHWLSRARSCPLSLAVDASCYRRDVRAYEVTESLQPYTSQVARLLLAFDEVTAPELLLKDVPMLEHLTLRGWLGHWHPRRISITQPQPRLRSLTIISKPFSPGVLSFFDPGWANLTRVEVSLLSRPAESNLGVFWTLLQLCPNLEDFIFSSVQEHNDAPTCPLLQHPKLSSLDVVVVSNVGCLVKSLILPNLRHLKISSVNPIPATWRQEEFKAFLSLSRCPLETLKIVDRMQVSVEEDWAEYTALIPTLKHLDLGSAMVGPV